jgi:hypothetical protein
MGKVMGKAKVRAKVSAIFAVNNYVLAQKIAEIAIFCDSRYFSNLQNPSLLHSPIILHIKWGRSQDIQLEFIGRLGL